MTTSDPGSSSLCKKVLAVFASILFTISHLNPSERVGRASGCSALCLVPQVQLLTPVAVIQKDIYFICSFSRSGYHGPNQ